MRNSVFFRSNREIFFDGLDDCFTAPPIDGTFCSSSGRRFKPAPIPPALRFDGRAQRERIRPSGKFYRYDQDDVMPKSF